MKVVFINRYFYPDHSATSQLLYDLTRHLVSQAIEVHVLTSRQLYNDPAAGLPCEEQHEGIVIHRLNTSTLGRAKLWGRALDYATFYLSAAAALFKYVRAGDVVVAKTDPPLIAVVGAVVTSLTGARLINWTQDLFPEVASALKVAGVGVVGQGLRHLRNRALLMASQNIVIGERMADHLRAEGIPALSIRVIHNWADGMTIRPIPHDDNPLRMEWSLRGKFIVGYSGNLGRAHEFQTILQAAEQLRDSPNIRFLFIGAGVGLLPLQQEVNRRGLSNVLFQPYQPREQLSYSLSVADLHLVSLRPALEGLIVPSKVYGIAAAGRPILFMGSPTGEIAQILRDHHCGYTVGVGEVDQTVTIISRLASDEVECRRLGQAARMALEQHYDKQAAFRAWDKTLAPWLNAA